MNNTFKNTALSLPKILFVYFIYTAEVYGGGNDPVGPAIRATVPDEAQDSSGNEGTAVPSKEFKVGWGVGAPPADERPKALTYAWEWRVHEDYKATAKRVPESFFDDASKSKPIVSKPQWYAETGSKWLKIQEDNRIPGPCVNMGEGDRPRCKYQVRCCVLFDDGTGSITPWVNWDVYVYKSSPLTSRAKFFKNSIGIFATPNVEADDDKQANDKYIARVTNRGDFKRVSAQISTYGGMTNSNGFWNKIIVTHEGEHVKQWSSQDPWKELYNADTLWLMLQNMTADGDSKFNAKSNLRAALQDAIQAQDADDKKCADDTWGWRERLAHGLSNAVDPDFLEVDPNCYDPIPAGPW